MSKTFVTTHDDVYLQNNFTIACRDWREVTLAGLVAVELGVSGPAPAVIDPAGSRRVGRLDSSRIRDPAGRSEGVFAR